MKRGLADTLLRKTSSVSLHPVRFSISQGKW